MANARDGPGPVIGAGGCAASFPTLAIVNRSPAGCAHSSRAERSRPRSPPPRCHPSRFWPPAANEGMTAGVFLEGLVDEAGDFADDAASEGQDADHEDGALDHGDPGAELGEVVLERDHDEGTDDGTEHGAEAS